MLLTPPRQYCSAPSPKGPATTAPAPSRISRTQRSLLVVKSPGRVSGLVVLVADTTEASRVQMLIQLSLPPSERSVFRPPSAVRFSITVMMVPLGSDARAGFWLSVMEPL